VYSKTIYGLALVMAAGMSTLNAVRSRKSIRLFWSFLAAALGAWSINSCVWIYDVLLLGSSRPAYLPANVPLILRTVLIIAAVASRPHLEVSRQRGYRATLNFLLLLFFWVFAYALLLVQQPLTTWDTALYLRVDALYAGQNFFLLGVLGVLILRAQPPWKLIYWQLLGAANLYVLTSLAANLVFIFGGYRPRWVDVAFTTAACWFVWIALEGRKRAAQLEQSLRSDTTGTKYTSLLAMLSVVAIPMIGLWELFRTDEASRTHEIRLFIVLVAVLSLGVCAFVEGYLTNRDLSSEAGLANERFRLAAQAGKMYAYEWDVATDLVKHSAEHANVLGFIDPGKQLTRQRLLDRVHPDDRGLFVNSVRELVPENPITRISYRVVRPDGAEVWLERRARAFFGPDGKMLRMVGMTADITERKRAEEALASMSQKLIEAGEQERARIARELHDNTNQHLAMLVMEIEQLRHDLPQPMVELHGRMDELRKHTLEISDDVRALAHELHPPALEYLGLVGAAKGFCQEFGEHEKAEIDFETRDVPSALPPDISLCLFRVLQEALHNSAKHSGVRHFEVELWGTEEEVHLTISDSGVGFHPEAAREGRGLGLTSMQERARLLKGTFSIESKPRLGTTIHVRLPLGAGVDSLRTAG
jgi:PAS domain S-box-containing protein